MVEDKIHAKVGGRIRKFRKQKGWTLDKLSEMSGLHPSSISQIERGERNITLRNIGRLADGLGIEPFQLFLFDMDELMGAEEATEFKVKELWEQAPEEKKELMYHLARIIIEWSPDSFWV